APPRWVRLSRRGRLAPDGLDPVVGLRCALTPGAALAAAPAPGTTGPAPVGTGGPSDATAAPEPADAEDQ
ncbi:MAG: hypothetical protein JXB32_14210, partial [Deltaproteobacteria bacterium]|nr:hypothetical protein [Deltaproteobacteria bacterium]